MRPLRELFYKPESSHFRDGQTPIRELPSSLDIRVIFGLQKGGSRVKGIAMPSLCCRAVIEAHFASLSAFWVFLASNISNQWCPLQYETVTFFFGAHTASRSCKISFLCFTFPSVFRSHLCICMAPQTIYMQRHICN